MGSFKSPKVFMIGQTMVDRDALMEYLVYTGNEAFIDSYDAALAQGISQAEALISFMAKLCYESLTENKNKNVTKIRDIHDNFAGILSSAHGSCLEHASINFVVTDLSRVATHEQVRHRLASYSQTSGRYVRGDTFDIVGDPILSPILDGITIFHRDLEDMYCGWCDAMGLNGREGLIRRYTSPSGKSPSPEYIEERVELLGIDPDKLDFNYKKKATSALRRMLPNGIANKLGFTLNLRTIRHIVMIRTSRHAEREIRDIYDQVYKLVKAKFPLIFADAHEEMVEGFLEITGCRQQPYDLTAEQVIARAPDEALIKELNRRNEATSELAQDDGWKRAAPEVDKFREKITAKWDKSISIFKPKSSIGSLMFKDKLYYFDGPKHLISVLLMLHDEGQVSLAESVVQARLEKEFGKEIKERVSDKLGT